MQYGIFEYIISLPAKLSSFIRSYIHSISIFTIVYTPSRKACFDGVRGSESSYDIDIGLLRVALNVPFSRVWACMGLSCRDTYKLLAK